MGMLTGVTREQSLFACAQFNYFIISCAHIITLRRAQGIASTNQQINSSSKGQLLLLKGINQWDWFVVNG